jgi:hypothetical protein
VFDMFRPGLLSFLQGGAFYKPFAAGARIDHRNPGH